MTDEVKNEALAENVIAETKVTQKVIHKSNEEQMAIARHHQKLNAKNENNLNKEVPKLLKNERPPYKNWKDLPAPLTGGLALMTLVLVVGSFILVHKKVKMIFVSLLMIPTALFFGMLISMIIITLYWTMQ